MYSKLLPVTSAGMTWQYHRTFRESPWQGSPVPLLLLLQPLLCMSAIQNAWLSAKIGLRVTGIIKICIPIPHSTEENIFPTNVFPTNIFPINVFRINIFPINVFRTKKSYHTYRKHIIPGLQLDSKEIKIKGRVGMQLPKNLSLFLKLASNFKRRGKG